MIPIQSPTLPAPVGDRRIDTIAIYPGCDALHIEASIAAGASGIVLAALGSGNTTPCVVEAVRECSRRNIPLQFQAAYRKAY